VLRETAGASTNYFLWGLDLSGTMQGAGGVGGLLAVVVDGAAPATYYPCYDANGNITSYVDESGAVRASYVFDAFGQTISQGGDMAATFSHRFSTKYVDDETGLYYYGYRYYAPGLGRWVSRDPIEEQGGLNILCFNRNNPTTEIDVLGLYNPVTGSGGPYPSEPFPGPYPQAQTSGPDVTAAVLATLADIENVYKGWTLEQRCKACITLYTDRKSGWDIFPLYYLGIGYTKDWPFVGRASDGQYTVQFKGKGYHASAVNYVMWGKANKLCHETFRTPFIDMWSLNIALTAATAHKIFPPNWYAQANEAQAFTIYGYTGFLPQVLPLPWVGRPSGLRTSPDLVGPSQPFNWRWMPNHP
jgi:RHS repeat-associated protein